MQSDIILVQPERTLLHLAGEVVALVNSSKFAASAGHQLCELSAIHTVITDSGITDESAKMTEKAGIRLITCRFDDLAPVDRAVCRLVGAFATNSEH